MRQVLVPTPLNVNTRSVYPAVGSLLQQCHWTQKLTGETLRQKETTVTKENKQTKNIFQPPNIIMKVGNDVMNLMLEQIKTSFQMLQLAAKCGL